MCDKKNNVLFTDTECVVLSSDFKLHDEDHVSLRVPRENNMYNVDLKNVVPSEDLTCLFAKATLDESNLWHRRLGHINFKIMNKLVKGYVAFGGNPQGGKITGKDTKCVVLSSDFKLPDEDHVSLRVPRENNMYNVDLKNVVPSEDLTCLFTKATLDESNLWHRRLGHINFKIMNKLVKGNLVRGSPSKIFEKSLNKKVTA
nr:ribonuclease H-like domain-containing protein [Tanacetum cinerariifolium]